MELIIMILLGFLLFGLGIYALVVFFQDPRPTKPDYLIGALAAGFLLLGEIVIVVLSPDSFANTNAIITLVITDIIALLKIFVITIVGIKLCREHGYRWSALESPRLDSLWRPLILIAVFVPVLIGYSILFLEWLQPTLGIALQTEDSGEPVKLSARIAGATALVEFAVLEELTYRGGITILLYRILKIERCRYFVSAGIATLLWTLSHAGSLDPSWVKYVQIAPLGVLCAWLMYRFGIESAILAHVSFNLAFVFFDLEIGT